MRRQRGVVLVIALAILAGLVALIVSVVATQHVALRAEANRVDAQRARIAAQAGIQRALASLENTIQTTTTTAGSTVSGTTVQGQAQIQTDEWYTLGDTGNERFQVGNATFRMQIIDASSLVNINTALEAQLDLLPLTTQQIASLLDWREAGTTARTEGAKDDYYNALSKPYNTALRKFDTIDELLDVRYFTPSDIWQINDNSTSSVALPALADGRQAVLADLITTDSASPLLNPNGTAQVNVNVANASNALTQAGVSRQAAQAIQQGGTNYANLGAVLQRIGQADYGAVLDNVKIGTATTATGKFNLNTVSEASLMTIPNMTEDLAQGIVNYQATGFTKLSDLLLVSGFTDGNNLRQFAGYFTVRSSVFLVRVVGECNGSQVALEAVVDISSGTPLLTKMYDQPFADTPNRWGWADTTTTDTVLVDAS